MTDEYDVVIIGGGIAGASPVPLTPYLRSAILYPTPDGLGVSDWPFLGAEEHDLYFEPESGGILMSPADETPRPRASTFLLPNSRKMISSVKPPYNEATAPRQTRPSPECPACPNTNSCGIDFAKTDSSRPTITEALPTPRANANKTNRDAFLLSPGAPASA